MKCPQAISLCASAGLFTVILAAGAQAQTPVPIHVGVVPSTSTGGLYVAKEKGYFTQSWPRRDH